MSKMVDTDKIGKITVRVVRIGALVFLVVGVVVFFTFMVLSSITL